MAQHIAHHARGLDDDKLTEPEAMLRALIYKVQQLNEGVDFWDMAETTFDARTSYEEGAYPDTEIIVTIKASIYGAPFPLIEQEQLRAIQNGVPVEDVLA